MLTKRLCSQIAAAALGIAVAYVAYRMWLGGLPVIRIELIRL